MRVRQIICSAFFLLSVNVSAACDCQWNGPFTWLTDDAGAIILGKVVSHKGNSLDLQVEQVLKGKEYRETIRIWGQQKQDCRANLAQFTSGTRWIFLLDPITEIPLGGFNPETPNISYGRLQDYGLQRCGAY